MLRILFLILILTHSINFARAQENAEQKNIPTAELIDEFGRLGECDLRSRIDNLLIKLQGNPGVNGYVILYQGANALPAEYEFNWMERLIRNHITLRNYDASRVVFLNGVFRKEPSTEFWIVPNGANPPKPTDTVPKPKIPTDKTFLFDRNYLQTEFNDVSDEFILPSVKARIEEENRIAEEEYKRENPETEAEINKSEIKEEEVEIDERSPEEIENEKYHWININFGTLIKKQKNSRGLLIFYADDTYYDVAKLINHIEEGKRKMAKEANISPDKIEVLFGGYRSGVEVEFWIIPKKGAFPTPTPQVREIEEDEVEDN